MSEKGNPVIDLTSEPTAEQTDLQRAIALSLKDTQQTSTLGKATYSSLLSKKPVSETETVGEIKNLATKAWSKHETDVWLE